MPNLETTTASDLLGRIVSAPPAAPSRDAVEHRAPIRVGFVLHVMQVAGAEVLVAEIIKRLGPAIEPVIFCLDAIGAIGQSLQAAGVPVVVLGRRPGLDLAVAARLRREIRRRRIDVIHAHQYTPLFYSALARAGVRHVHLMFTEHGRHYPDIVSGRRRLANRWVLSHLVDEINAVAAFSADSLATVEGFSRHPIEVIANGIDVDRYGPAADRAALRTRLGLDPRRRYVSSIARFHPVKDHATLIRGFAIAAGRVPDADLLLAGDGPMRDAAERLAADLGVASRVRFLGIRRDVAAVLQASDVFALNSVSEAASLTVLEAMACGLPVVATAVGGNPEMVRDGIDGLLVPRRNPEATAHALTRLLQDEATRTSMGRSGLRRVRERYRLDTTVCRYHERYARAAARVRACATRPLTRTATQPPGRPAGWPQPQP